MEGNSRKMKKNILFIISGVNRAGAELQLLHLIQELSKTDEFVPILWSLSGDGDLSSEFNKLNIASIRSSTTGRLAFFRQLQAVLRLHVNIIQGWMSHGNLLACFIKLFKPHASVFLSVRSGQPSANKRLTQFITLLVGLLSHCVPSMVTYGTTISYKEHRCFGYGKKNMAILPHCVVHKRGNGTFNTQLSTQKIITVGHLGRWDISKNQMAFLQSVALLSHGVDGGRYRFIMGGQNVDYNNRQIQLMADQHGLHGCLECLGPVANVVDDFFSKVDIVVCSSLYEATGGVLAEAIASGIFVVATNVGFASEYIKKQSLLIDPNDPILPEKLAEGVRNLCSENSTEVYSLFEDAQKIILSTMTPEVMANNFRALYRNIGC